MRLAPSVRKISPAGEIVGGATWATRHRTSGYTQYSSNGDDFMN